MVSSPSVINPRKLPSARVLTNLEIGKDWSFRWSPGRWRVQKCSAQPCIMHGRRAELQSAESVEWRATPPNSTRERALSSHTFNNESPSRPINILCLSVASQPKPGCIIWICPCIATRSVCWRTYHAYSVCTKPLALSVIYGRHNNKYIRRRRRACERH